LILQAGERRECVRMIVQDSGYGISAKHLQHIFERFYRVEATRPRYGPPHGSGLGLPIAKSIVETHGGKIAVTSQIGVGTTFLVELPATGQKN
jgi:signal transduction histidine kinase